MAVPAPGAKRPSDSAGPPCTRRRLEQPSDVDADDELSDEDQRPRLLRTGLVATPQPEEAEFFFNEIWKRRLYLRHGLTLPPGAVVIDAGANIGAFSLFCLQESPTATVHCFEPASVCRKALRRNLRRWIWTGQVRVYSCALGAAGDRPVDVLCYLPDAPGESTRRPSERDLLDVRLRADDCIAEYRDLLVRHGVQRDTVSSLVAEASTAPRGGRSSADFGVPQRVHVRTLASAFFDHSSGDVDLLWHVWCGRCCAHSQGRRGG
eukprot:TRINITY_DN18558_c0_g1_i1.p1 TRINITY_DN18558_c0_g1~~TRINITY_DN18558_c0_g1_i1.p1  ORF type:complete len:293 (+),score=47.77 TRINITY_DN18558_c0_g1_i1:89-880(+)